MNRFLFFFILTAMFITLPGQTVSAENGPNKIAGLALGGQIAAYIDLVRMETAMPIRDQQYLRVVAIRNLEGYKSGTVAFGSCASPGQVVRIKLKYEHSDKKFYEALLDRFKKKFGEPDKWRGDPFHVIIAWKWSFRDKDNNKISLTLQHSRDEDYKWGNSVKLTNTTQVEKEQNCYRQKSQGKSGSKKGKSSPKRKKLKEEDYQKFIPD